MKIENSIHNPCTYGNDDCPKCNPKTKNLIIAYGSENITLNRGDEHLVLSKTELAFIVESAIKNNEVEIKVFSNK